MIITFEYDIAHKLFFSIGICLYRTLKNNEMVATKQNKKSFNLYQKVFGDIEFNRYVIMAHTLVIQSCAGSVAVYYIMHLDDVISTVLLSLMAAITMGANAVAIAQGPMKTVIGMCLLTVITSILVIIYGVFSM